MNKNFDDFLKTLTKEQINEICNNIDDIKLNFSLNQEGFKNLFSSISVVDIQLTLGILRLYHDWLNS
ncbi:hypothetical protein G6Z26_04535 [Clostridium perfringens]|uniref:hypothetical protein n=1 Tax=Clostridium perfringens TaxID=1502 RepID=UPI0013E30953|nr:hypothetical protein [Clostridium perfringens]NGT31316.1 hypothetical protein [Clostridium perfringens]NGU09036.1 hypothetical protein [Clostridium perfringens]